MNRDYLKLMHPLGSLSVAISMSAIARTLVWYDRVLLIAAASLIAAGAFVINDYFDVKIDRINRPDELIVTKSISRKSALRFGVALSVLGVVCGLVLAYLASSTPLAWIFLLVPGLLWFYSSSYKRMLIVGDLVVSFCAALMPITVMLVEMSAPNPEFEPMVHLIIAGIIFCFTWIALIIESRWDIEGDREMECHTIPVVWGDKASRIVIIVLGLIIVSLVALVIVGYLLK